MKIVKNHVINNSLNINSICKKFIEINCKDDFEHLNDYIKTNNEQILVLGEGTNIVPPDIFNGLVIKPNFKNIDFSENEVSVGSTVNWHSFVELCISKNIFGFENLSLIPGSVGAAPVQNIGAYGLEVSSLITKVHCYDIENNNFITLSNRECEFSYRDSIFKKNKYLIYKVDFKTDNEEIFFLEYKALKQQINKLELDESKLTIKQVSDLVCSIRKSVLPDHNKIPNVGSFFKNPVITKKELKNIPYDLNDLIIWKINDDSYKIGAARLIEIIKKNIKPNNNVNIYNHHSLILTTNSNATQKDVLDVAGDIKKNILNTFNIELEIEPKLI